MYYLIINDGAIGPFDTELIAVKRYQAIIAAGTRVLSAYVSYKGQLIRRII